MFFRSDVLVLLSLALSYSWETRSLDPIDLCPLRLHPSELKYTLPQSLRRQLIFLSNATWSQFELGGGVIWPVNGIITLTSFTSQMSFAEERYRAPLDQEKNDLPGKTEFCRTWRADSSILPWFPTRSQCLLEIAFRGEVSKLTSPQGEAVNPFSPP